MGTGRGGIKRFSSTLDWMLFAQARGKPIRALHLFLCDTGSDLVCGSCQARSKRPFAKGRGSAGLRRLSRRGSWVRIPPPAPKKTSTSQHLTASSIPLARSGTRGLCKSHKKFFSKPSFYLGWIPGLFFRNGFVIGLSVIFRSVHIPVATSVKYRALEDRSPRIGIGADCSLVSPCPVQNRRLLRLVRWLLFGGWLSKEHVARRRFFLGFLLEDLLFQDYEFPLHRFLSHAP